jgi:hypothetical protein
MCPTKKEWSEKMFYGDYSHELAKERIETAIRAHEHDRLASSFAWLARTCAAARLPAPVRSS